MIVVYHHEGCSKSREAVRLIRQAGHAPVLVDYAREGWTRAHLLGLFAAAGVTPRDALREADMREAGRDPGTMTEAAVLDAMVADPVLVQRPFVCAPGGVRLCRPPGRVLDIIEAEGPVFDADGTPVTGPMGARLA